MISHVLRHHRPASPMPLRLSSREPQYDGLTLMDAVEQELKAALECRHGGTAHLAYIDAVSVMVPSQPVWDGIVLVFDLDGHPEAERAYAWFAPVRESDERRLHITLHGPLIRSAHDAVTAALVNADRLPQSPNARTSVRFV